MMAKIEMSPLYLVDASIYVFRAYFSIPDTFVDAKGESVNAVYGYTQFLLDVLEKQPESVSVAFDESLNTCYRNEIYPLYKANREMPDDNLKYQFSCCQEITNLLGLHSLSLKEYEADDIIGTLLTRFAKDRSAIILTRDKDLGQLLRSEDKLWDFAANQFSGPAEIKEKFGVEAHQIADYLALAGDAVDNIPGAPGIGAKTAAVLLSHFGTLDAIFAALDEVRNIGLRGAARAQKSLQENEELIRMFQEITLIKCDVPMSVSVQDFVVTPQPLHKLLEFCDRVNFGSGVRKRIEKFSDKCSDKNG
jgi:DNA polymerase-1